MKQTAKIRLRTGFTGYYGMNNFGDDLFGAICVAAAREFWQAEPLLVGPPLNHVDAATTVPGWFSARAYGAAGMVGKAGRLLSFYRGLHGSDVLVMGGGSVINDRESFRKPMMLAAKRSRGVQLAAIGVSIGPFKSAESQSRVASFIQEFAYVSVRDRRSFQLATEMGLSRTLHDGRDLAGLLPSLDAAPPKPRAAPGARLTIGVAPCNYADGGEYQAVPRAKWEDATVEALAMLARTRPVDVLLFSLNEHPVHGDQQIADRMRQALLLRGVEATRWRYAGSSPRAAVEALGRCDAIISARLHGAIVAYMQGVPFCIVDYHPKCKDFANDVGLPPLQCITSRFCDAAAVGAGVQSMLDQANGPALSPIDYANQAQEVFNCAPWTQTQASL